MFWESIRTYLFDFFNILLQLEIIQNDGYEQTQQNLIFFSRKKI